MTVVAQLDFEKKEKKRKVFPSLAFAQQPSESIVFFLWRKKCDVRLNILFCQRENAFLFEYAQHLYFKVAGFV